MAAKNESLWQEQMIRQNKIIDTLLNRCNELEERCKAYQEWWQHIIRAGEENADFADLFRNLASPSTDSATGIRETFLSIIQKMEGSFKTFYPYPDLMMGKDEAKLSITDLMVGKDERTVCITNLMVGNNETNHTHHKKMDGGVEAKYGNTHTAQGSVKGTDKPAENKACTAGMQMHTGEQTNNTSATSNGVAGKKEGKIDQWRLQHLISRIIVRSNSTGLCNAAAMLERLEQSPNQSMKQLQSLTGLTQTGMGKRIASLKRFGLIRRGPHRQLLLTDKARELLDKARR